MLPLWPRLDRLSDSQHHNLQQSKWCVQITLQEIDAGRLWKGKVAPPIACEYWGLKPGASMRGELTLTTTGLCVGLAGHAGWVREWCMLASISASTVWQRLRGRVLTHTRTSRRCVPHTRVNYYSNLTCLPPLLLYVVAHPLPPDLILAVRADEACHVSLLTHDGLGICLACRAHMCVRLPGD
mgnify:CR=1 FL=1